MINLCKRIINWFCKRNKEVYKEGKKTDEEIREEAKKMLNEWQVSMYANNRYLQKIPANIINEKYETFIIQIKKEENNKLKK
jgi:hypothetical protein